METPTLSQNEIEVIKKMAEGLSNKMMRGTVRYSEASIETVKYNIYKKLGVRNGCECVAYAIRSGIIQ